MYLTFRPSKGSVFIPRLVKCLSATADAFLIVLVAWCFVNLCYPFWGWITFASIWTGVVSHPFFFWLFDCIVSRSFIVARFHPTDCLFSPHNSHLKHFGFLFSVWGDSDSLTLGWYHLYDGWHCPRRRFVKLYNYDTYSKWLGWIIVVLTDAIPIAVLAGLFCTGYFLGIGSIVFFVMGLILSLKLYVLLFRIQDIRADWKKGVFLKEKLCTLKSLGIMMCTLEGPEGELFLTPIELAEYYNFVPHAWLSVTDRVSCACCTSISALVPPGEIV
jgi:hypothetical protein